MKLTEKELKSLKNAGYFLLESDSETQKIMQVFQNIYQVTLPIKGWTQTDILALSVAIFFLRNSND